MRHKGSLPDGAAITASLFCIPEAMTEDNKYNLYGE
jgi:hypothetical protein